MLHETTADINHDIAKLITCRIIENNNPNDVVPCNSICKTRALVVRLHDRFYFQKEITATPRKTTKQKYVLNKAREYTRDNHRAGESCWEDITK